MNIYTWGSYHSLIIKPLRIIGLEVTPSTIIRVKVNPHIARLSVASRVANYVPHLFLSVYQDSKLGLNAVDCFDFEEEKLQAIRAFSPAIFSNHIKLKRSVSNKRSNLKSSRMRNIKRMLYSFVAYFINNYLDSFLIKLAHFYWDILDAFFSGKISTIYLFMSLL